MACAVGGTFSSGVYKLSGRDNNNNNNSVAEWLTHPVFQCLNHCLSFRLMQIAEHSLPDYSLFNNNNNKRTCIAP